MHEQVRGQTLIEPDARRRSYREREPRESAYGAAMIARPLRKRFTAGRDAHGQNRYRKAAADSRGQARRLVYARLYREVDRTCRSGIRRRATRFVDECRCTSPRLPRADRLVADFARIDQGTHSETTAVTECVTIHQGCPGLRVLNHRGRMQSNS